MLLLQGQVSQYPTPVGDTKKAREVLNKALKQNPHVPTYLSGRKRLPRKLLEYIIIGGEDEAIFYVCDSLEVWAKVEGALEWLAKGSRGLSELREKSAVSVMAL